MRTRRESAPGDIGVGKVNPGKRKDGERSTQNLKIGKCRIHPLTPPTPKNPPQDATEKIRPAFRALENVTGKKRRSAAFKERL